MRLFINEPYVGIEVRFCFSIQLAFYAITLGKYFFLWAISTLKIHLILDPMPWNFSQLSIFTLQGMLDFNEFSVVAIFSLQ